MFYSLEVSRQFAINQAVIYLCMYYFLFIFILIPFLSKYKYGKVLTALLSTKEKEVVFAPFLPESSLKHAHFETHTP